MDDKGQNPAATKTDALRLFHGGEFQGARAAFAKLCEENSGDHELWMMLGLCHLELGNTNEAISALQRAGEVKPDFAPAHARLGQAYLAQMRFAEATASFAEALRINPGNPKSLVAIGEALIAQGRYDEAAERAREALRYFPSSGKLHAQLAVALERAHHLDEARIAAGRALELQPDESRAQLTLAILDRREGKPADARPRLEALQGAPLTPPQRAAVATELGRVLDQLGEFAAAFRAFVAGNRALDEEVARKRLDSQAFLRHIRRNQQWFTAETTRDWVDQEPQDGQRSPVFLVGFPRSGTTLTEQIIATVDGVVATDEQPILHRLINDLGTMFGRPVDYPLGLNELSESELRWLRLHYWSLAEELVGTVPEGETLLDKLPLNLVELGLVYRLFPKARVVVVLRDPRDSCLSCYTHSFVLNQAMVNFLDLQRTAKLYEATMGLWLHYRSFLKLPFLEVRYEDLVANLEGEARRLIDFLGLDWTDRILRHHEHARSRGVKTPSYSAVASPIYDQAVGRWRNYETELRPILGVLQPFVKTFGYE